MIEECQELVRRCETVVSRRGLVLDSAVIDRAIHRTWGGFAYLLMGLESGALVAAVWGGATLTLAFACATLMPGDLDDSTKTAALYLCLMAPAVLLIFEVPSALGTRGVSVRSVDHIAKLIDEMAPNQARLDALREGVDIFRSRAEARSKSISWALGIGWAVASWYASHTLLAVGTPESVRSAAALELFAFASIAFTTYVFAASYSAATRITFQTLSFAFLKLGACRNVEQER